MPALAASWAERLRAPVHANAAQNPDSLLNTLRYAFFHQRCGIVVGIRAAVVVVFAPFANREYRNVWSQDGTVPVAWRVGSIVVDSGAAYQAEKRTAAGGAPESWLPVSQWWNNGGVLCNVEQEDVWSSTHNEDLFAMLTAACADGRVPDVDFVLNKRDYPYLKRDGSEPLSRFTGMTARVREVYASYVPVLSFYGGTAFADCMMPLVEDWQEAARRGGSAAATWDDEGWETTYQVAVFRGAPSGYGACPVTNPRLALAEFSASRPDILDAKLTGRRSRDKLSSAAPLSGVQVFCTAFSAGEASRWGAPREPMASQVARCRYVVYADGHSAANRYGSLMWCQRTILRVATVQTEDCGTSWIMPDLVAARVDATGAVHLPRAADHFTIHPDLGNLCATVEYLRTHDAVARRVAKSALCKAPTTPSILAALQRLLFEVHVATVPPLACGGDEVLLPAAGGVSFSPYDARYARAGTAGPGVFCTGYGYHCVETKRPQ